MKKRTIKIKNSKHKSLCKLLLIKKGRIFKPALSFSIYYKDFIYTIIIMLFIYLCTYKMEFIFVLL